MATDEQIRPRQTDVPALRTVAEFGWGSGGGVSVPALASAVRVSERALGRRLQRLEQRGFVDVRSGEVRVTEAGQQFLWEEYRAYRALFSDRDDLVLRGTVTSGLGRGEHFVSLEGYRTQFVEELGYDPFPGTLNVALTDRSVRARVGFDPGRSVRIEGWRDGDETYGAAVCYPVSVRGDRESVDTAHVVVPVRTDHDLDELEILAPVEIRAVLDLEDGDEVTVSVTRER